LKTLGSLILLVLFCAAAALPAQQSSLKQAEPSASNSQTVPPHDWAPELLFAILSSPNPQADEELYRAAFAAGPSIIPRLQVALKDDRTADFAARSLAYIGGQKALDILSGLTDDSRDLDRRRFYYGALGEFPDPQATDILLNAVRDAERHSDRTVTESAIIALTVHTDAALAPKLRAMAKQIDDVVIQDDLENAADVIEARARYLASPAGKKAGGSIDQAIHTYFIPAFDEPPPEPSAASQAAHRKGKPTKPPVDVRIENLTFSPDKSRALAHVIFETPEALANYEMVLQKKLGDWSLASVWLGAESEKQGASQSSSPSGQ
jgi:hypothetical protein